MAQDKSKLTAREQKFRDIYINDPNARKAAEAAGYKPKAARQTGYNLLQKPKMQRAIAEAREKAAKKAGVTREWITGQLYANAIQCLVPGPNFHPSAANKALELLGKELNMFVDRRLVGLTKLDDMNEDQLLEFLGGEPDAEELGAAASVTQVGHA